MSYMFADSLRAGSGWNCTGGYLGLLSWKNNKIEHMAILINEIVSIKIPLNIS
jgi:hypothetical protein